MSVFTVRIETDSRSEIASALHAIAEGIELGCGIRGTFPVHDRHGEVVGNYGLDACEISEPVQDIVWLQGAPVPEHDRDFGER